MISKNAGNYLRTDSVLLPRRKDPIQVGQILHDEPAHAKNRPRAMVAKVAREGPTIGAHRVQSDDSRGARQEQTRRSATIRREPRVVEVL